MRPFRPLVRVPARRRPAAQAAASGRRVTSRSRPIHQARSGLTDLATTPIALLLLVASEAAAAAVAGGRALGRALAAGWERLLAQGAAARGVASYR
jgi:hypothetical protein